MSNKVGKKMTDVLEFDSVVKFPVEFVLVFEIVTRIILVVLTPFEKGFKNDLVIASVNERLVFNSK